MKRNLVLIASLASGVALTASLLANAAEPPMRERVSPTQSVVDQRAQSSDAGPQVGPAAAANTPRMLLPQPTKLHPRMRSQLA